MPCNTDDTIPADAIELGYTTDPADAAAAAAAAQARLAGLAARVHARSQKVAQDTLGLVNQILNPPPTDTSIATHYEALRRRADDADERAFWNSLDQAGNPIDPTDLVGFRLVPVEVFGAVPEPLVELTAEQWHEHYEKAESAWGYGLMDAASAWSDCNRAVGRIYRVDDLGHLDNDERREDTVEVFVRSADREFFQRRFGSDTPDTVLPAWVLPFVRWAEGETDGIAFRGVDLPPRLGELLAHGQALVNGAGE